MHNYKDRFQTIILLIALPVTLSVSSGCAKSSKELTKEPSRVWTSVKDGMKGICGDTDYYTLEKL